MGYRERTQDSGTLQLGMYTSKREGRLSVYMQKRDAACVTLLAGT